MSVCLSFSRFLSLAQSLLSLHTSTPSLIPLFFHLSLSTLECRVLDLSKFDVWNVTSSVVSIVNVASTSYSNSVNTARKDLHSTAQTAEKKSLDFTGYKGSTGDEGSTGRSRVEEFKRALSGPSLASATRVTSLLTCLVHIGVTLPDKWSMTRTKEDIDLTLFREYTNGQLQVFVNATLAALMHGNRRESRDKNGRKTKVFSAIIERITEKDDVRLISAIAADRPSNEDYLAVFPSSTDEYVITNFDLSYLSFTKCSAFFIPFFFRNTENTRLHCTYHLLVRYTTPRFTEG